MGVGRGSRGTKAPLDAENIIKKGYFLSFEREKSTFTTVAPLEKFWKNPLVAPPGRNLSDTHVYGL